MAQPLIDLSQPETRQTRTELTLSRIARAWRTQPRGALFAQALVDFLSRQSSAATVRAYSYAVLELFEWFERARGRIPTPDAVRRADGAEYDKWLRERSLGLGRFRLANDPRRRMDLAIWDIIAERRGSRIDHIRSELGRTPEFATTEVRDGRMVRVLRIDRDWASLGGLARHLACLVRDRTLTRAPSLSELRRQGMPIGAEPDENVFQYDVSLPKTPAGSERSSGIASRLTALSSFWSYLASNGENAAGAAEPLLRYNIWRELLQRTQRQAVSHQEAARAATTPGMELFVRLVETTYQRTHGSYARAAAEATSYSRPVAASRVEPAFADLRDRALLLMMLQPGGPRASELQRMRRGDVSGDPPMVTILGKGGKKRVVPIPSGALDALRQLTQKLRVLAAHQRRYRGSNRAERLLRDDAPLLPVVAYWGANAGLPATRALSRAGIAMALRRRAEEAGIEPGTEAFKRIHPHGIRRLFSKEAIKSGTRLNVIQAMMGHASGATTLRYMEERDPEALVAEAFRGVTGPATEPEFVAGRTAPEVRQIAPPPEPPLPAAPRPVRVLPVEKVPAAAPPTPPLVGLGAPPEALPASTVDSWQKRLGRVLGPEERRELARCAREPSGSPEKLCEIYAVDWGERAKRSHERLQLEGKQVAEVAVAAGIADIERMMSGEEEEGVEMVARAESNRLWHTYAGTSSGLVWWWGNAGKLRPEMPVPSLDQIGTCGLGDDSDLCTRLSDLWRRWMAADTTGGGEVPAELRARGPTSACALIGWIADTLETAAQVEDGIRQREGRWVAPDAPWSETKLGAGQDVRRVFREHPVSQIMRWFEEVAWQHRTSRGKVSGGGLGRSARAPKVIGTLPKVPSWYGEPDPIASLSYDDRQELLDFLAAQTGDYELQDRSPRFQGASRRDLAEIIETMRRYDEQEDNVRDARARRKKGETTEREVSESRRVADEAARDADRTIRAVGGSAGFELKKAVASRVETRKVAGIGRESRHDFYLRMLGDLFGPEARTDPLLGMVARREPGPLAGYRDLLAPDFRSGTIRHRPRYADEFAESTGAHSECVARRLGRELWELWKSKKKGSGAFKRDKELRDLVDSMAAYRVPCPGAQEQELRARLIGRVEPVAIYERWAEAVGEAERELPGERRRVEMMEEIYAPFEEGVYLEASGREALREGRLFEKNPKACALRYDERVARRLPTPVEARWALRMAR